MGLRSVDFYPVVKRSNANRDIVTNHQFGQSLALARRKLVLAHNVRSPEELTDADRRSG